MTRYIPNYIYQPVMELYVIFVLLASMITFPLFVWWCRRRQCQR